MRRGAFVSFALVIAVLLGVVLSAPGCRRGVEPRIETERFAIEFDQRMHSRLSVKASEGAGVATELGDFGPSETIWLATGEITDFALVETTASEVADTFGDGHRLSLSGESDGIRKDVKVTVYADFPNAAVFEVSYTNASERAVEVTGWRSNHYTVAASGADEPAFWSFNGGSYESRPDWILPLDVGFRQANFQGMNASDYGGGTPVSDVWRRDVGVGVGHLETVPLQVSLPIARPSVAGAELGIEEETSVELPPGGGFATPPTFVVVHRGDAFETLSTYRELMKRRGVSFTTPPEDAYEPIWCAWGYQRDFRVEQIYGALPEVEELGYPWAVLDDGWQTAEGDWYVREDKFPGGEKGMRAFVRRLHDEGLKAKLWWVPMAADPDTDLLRDHPDYLLLNEDGSPQEISWWNAHYLCPAYPPVQEYTVALVKKIMEDWGYDGLKIDGQHLNGAPPCYNPAHGHARPEEAVEAVPELFRLIEEAALETKPDAVVEICPCGTMYSFFNLPHMNQAVASDPESSWQIRLKGKTLKALMGSGATYYGDHVELSDGGDDFASSVGVGAVIGTKFTWPPGSAERTRYDLTPEREEVWKQWLEIYTSKMLPKGTYRGELYDLGFDRPEAHAIAKDGNLYYAFYAETWSGPVELRGLEEKDYRVTDYVHDAELGTVSGPTARLDVAFEGFLLLEAVPE
jgi:alpha-galactosidase